MRSMFKDAGLDVAESLVAGKIAHLLATYAPDRVQDFLKDPQTILGFKIPAEWATTLGGSVVGVTIAEALGKLFPGIDIGAKNRIRRFATAVGEEMNDVAKRARRDAGESDTTDSSTGGRRIPMKPINIWLYNRGTKTVVLSSCPEAHQIKADGTVDTAYRPIDIALIVMGSIATPVPVPGCLCAAKLKEELAENSAPKSVPTPTGKTKPPSFMELVGEALASSNAALVAKVQALLALITVANLTVGERRLLEYCDNMKELAALAECENAVMLRLMLSQLRANAERGIMGEIGEWFQHAIRQLTDAGKWYKKGADARGTEMERRLAVLKLCETNEVTREEVFAVIESDFQGTLANVDQLTNHHVIYVITVQPGEIQSPIEKYWEAQQQKQQQRQQPAVTESGWGRLKKRLFHSAFGFGG